VAGVSAAGVVGAVTTAFLVLGAGPAAGWSTTPDSGLPGSPLRLTGSPGELCVWDETLPDGSAVSRYEGVRVEISFAGRAIGAVPVVHGGAWAGTLRVPVVSAGTYSVAARCIVVDPALPGGRTVDFATRSFAVAEAPPPTTVTTAAPVVIPPPVVERRPVAVVVTKRVTVRATRTATLPNTGPVATTLPNTGNGTLGIALAGIGSLAIGAGALWWGGRKRPVSADPPAGMGG
jgi:LPXTG-motif cell wall-anchored protein